MATRILPPPDLLRQRIRTSFFLMMAAYACLVGRLVYLQGSQGHELRMVGERNRRQNIPLHASRGAILARDDRPLAVSLYNGKVGFDPGQVRPADSTPAAARLVETRLERSIAKIASILRMPREKVASVVTGARAGLAAGRKSRFALVARDVPLDRVQAIRDARPPLVGFGIIDGTRRVYASGESAAHIVGFLDSTGRGATGLERSARRWLDGHEGFAIAEVDSRQREIPDTQRRLVASRDGVDIHTTIDAAVQQIATEEGRRTYAKFHPVGISIVVLDPISGDLLALASIPTFDPNPGRRRTFTPERLTERCATHLYEPGSTLKALTIAGAMQDGLINESSIFNCSGAMQVGNRTIHCVLHGPSEAHGHGNETPAAILRHSCNVAAAKIGMRLGPEKLFEIDRQFGLLEKPQVGLPGEQAGRLSFDRHEKIYTEAKAARVAFGHSITTTPFAVALAYAAIANGGNLMRPRLIRTVTDNGGALVYRQTAAVRRRVLSRTVSSEVSAMLRDVVSRGTGKIAAIPGYWVAGKTGTAKKYRAGAYVGSFVGYIPASPTATPRAVILVAVDEPRGSYYGAEVAAPAFRAIAARLMELWRVPHDDPQCVQASLAAQTPAEARRILLTARGR